MSEQIKSLQSALTHAIACTMEKMTFEEIEVVDFPINPETMRDGVWAVLEIHQPLAGEVVLELSKEYGAQLAREVCATAEDAEIKDEIVHDVVAEILNTLAGRFVDDLVSAQLKFELGLPITGNGRPQLLSKPAAAILVSVGGHYITATVSGKDFENFYKFNRSANESVGSG